MRGTIYRVTVKTVTRAETLEDILERADRALALVSAVMPSKSDRAGRNTGSQRWYENIPPGTIDSLVIAWQQGPNIERKVRRCRSTAEKRRWMRQHARLGGYMDVAVKALLGIAIGKSLNGKSASEIEEWRGEATLLLLKLLQDWVPKDGHTIEAYIGSRSTWVRSDVRHELAGWDEPKSWTRTRAVALRVGDELHESLGRYPSREEIRVAAEVRLREQVLDRRDSDETLDDEQVRRRLSRDGHLKALRELDAVLESGLAPLELDRPVGEDGDTLIDTLPSATPHAANSTGFTMERLFAVALGDDQWAAPALLGRLGVLGDIDGGTQTAGRSGTKTSYQDLADLTGRDVAEVRSVTKRALNRLVSPHAQFCHLTEMDFTMERPTLLGGYGPDDLGS
jgi:hypothetical protein